MRVRLREARQQAEHGSCCQCHSPVVVRFNHRIARGISRRSVLGGAAALFAASSLRNVPHALSADTDRPRLFTNAPIFDGHSSDLREGLDVLVSGTMIQDLVPVGSEVAGAEIIDCGGRVLMPGLIDSHVHITLSAISLIDAMTADVPYVHLVAAREAEQTLMRGFTTVRDVGGPTFALKRAIDEGMFIGPRIYPSGAMITQTGGHFGFRLRGEVPRSPLSGLSHTETGGVAAIADGESEVLRRTREQLMLGASQVKIAVGGGVTSVYDTINDTQFTAKEIRAAVNAARDWGAYVCAHVYVSEGIRRAIDNGVQSIEHGQLADEETVMRMADAGVWWSLQPFLIDDDSNPKSSPKQQQEQRDVATGTERAFEWSQKYDVKTVWGTDILFSPGKTWTQNRQLTKLARWFAPSDVLKLATSRPAELLTLSGDRNPYPGKLGVIEPGALADLLIVDGNPLKDISLLADPAKNLKLIMKDGVVYKNDLRG